MTFAGKAHYAGPFDDDGVPLLDYHGSIGRQYNPIAIAQYGLACLNAGERKDSGFRFQVSGFRACADWLVTNLEKNAAGLKVWHHKFDWEYFRTLKAPWYSGLAQGQGISLLVRAFRETGEVKYREAAEAAFVSMVTPIEDGGILFVDKAGDWWIEEYITDPPTHILNGFMWALWGVRDYISVQCSGFSVQESGMQTGWPVASQAVLLDTLQPTLVKAATDLWQRSLETLEHNIGRFDSGFWSLYDLAPLSMQNPASEFYHALHIVQLEVMHRLTGKSVFRETAERWRRYAEKPFYRRRAVLAKVLFKLLHY